MGYRLLNQKAVTLLKTGINSTFIHHEDRVHNKSTKLQEYTNRRLRTGISIRKQFRQDKIVQTFADIQNS